MQVTDKITIMNIYDFIKETGDFKGDFLIRPQIVCNDGFKMSVQASYGHYCNPRISNIDFYNSVEVGYPSEDEPLIFEYAKDKGQWTQTVYGWIPTEIIQKVIEKHGGIDINKTFNK